MKHPKTYLPTAVLLLAFSGSAFAESYVDGSKPFTAIENVHREAEAWAACSVTYDLTANLLQSDSPARSKQLSELANGAKVAIAMTHVLRDLNRDTTPEGFATLWETSKMLMETVPETLRTYILAQAEALDADQFFDNLKATLAICTENLEGQQMYIDTWRELAKSGLLTSPEN